MEISNLFSYLKSIDVQVTNGHALDFGCGVGRLTQSLANIFTYVSGVDIAPSMIENANRYNERGACCNYLVNDKEDLTMFSDNSFDFIYSNIVLQHMEPRYSKKYLQEFIRILRMDGIAVFQIPSEKKKIQFKKHTINSRIRKKIRALISKPSSKMDEPIMEMYAIKREEIVEIVNNCGAKILDIATDNSTGKWISYRYCIQKNNSQTAY